MAKELYHILKDGIPSEVLTRKELIEKVKNNILNKDTLIWCSKWNDNGNSQEWKKIEEVFDVEKEVNKIFNSNGHSSWKYTLISLGILIPVIVVSFLFYNHSKFKKAKLECEYYIKNIVTKPYSNIGDDIKIKYFNQCKIATDYGDATSQYNFGKFFDHEYGNIDHPSIHKDNKIAIKWYKKSANSGEINAQKELAKIYYYGKNIAKDYQEAFKWYKMAAKQNDTESELMVAKMYFNGEGIIKNFYEAFYWFQKAADKDNKEALFYLGTMYYYGYGTTKNIYKTDSLYKKIVEDYNKSAGICYRYLDDQLGVKKHPELIFFMKIAAEKENMGCANWLGNIYLWGYGVKQDYAEAFHWYQMTANHGNVYGQDKLGDMYRNGKGVVKDYSKALMYYKMAANNHYHTSENKIGEMYFYGEGVTQNYDEALIWFKKAAKGDTHNIREWGGKKIHGSGLEIVRHNIIWQICIFQEQVLKRI